MVYFLSLQGHINWHIYKHKGFKNKQDNYWILFNTINKPGYDNFILIYVLHLILHWCASNDKAFSITRFIQLLFFLVLSKFTLQFCV